MLNNYMQFERIWNYFSSRYMKKLGDKNENNYVKVFEASLNTFDDSRGGYGSYAYHLVRGSFYRQYKRYRGFQDMSITGFEQFLDERESTVAAVETAVTVAKVMATARKKLSARNVSILEDIYIKEKSVTEVSEMQGISKQRISQIIDRSVAVLRKELCHD